MEWPHEKFELLPVESTDWEYKDREDFLQQFTPTELQAIIEARNSLGAECWVWCEGDPGSYPNKWEEININPEEYDNHFKKFYKNLGN